ncbi:MAG: hypothetical protein AAF699_00020 [Pseudomonadota bacterium]
MDRSLTRDKTRNRNQSRYGGESYDTKKMLVIISGLVLLVLALPPFFDFPGVQFWLLPLAAGYLFLLFLLPRLWLYVLPVATVCLDFTPWTGRFAYNEFDLLFLITIASGLIFRRYRFRVYSPKPALFVLWAYMILVAWGFSGWGVFLLPPEESLGNTYYSSNYAYKLVKGLLWGVLLVPMWGYLLAVDKRRAVAALVMGSSFAALTLLIVVFWERGVLDAVFSGATNLEQSTASGYQRLPRITGLFSDMHTGGDAMSGVLLLLMPACLYLTMARAALWKQLIGGMACLAVVSIVLLSGNPNTVTALGICLATYTVMSFLVKIGEGGSQRLLPISLVVLCVAAVLIAVGSYLTAGLLGLAGFLLLGASGLFLWRERLIRTRSHFLWLIAVVSLGVIVVGYGINPAVERSIGEQVSERSSWVSVINAGDRGLARALVGNGVGSYPALYTKAHSDESERLGAFEIVSESQREILKLTSGSDLVLAQRIPVIPYSKFRVEVFLRSTQAGQLTVSLCERNISLLPDSEGSCVREELAFQDTQGVFEPFSVEINSGEIGHRRWLARWPTAFSIQVPVSIEALEIDAITFTKEGFNNLRNGSFKRGLDHWFYYYDTTDRAWHVNNLWLQIWLESGFVGLILFVTLIVLLIRANFKAHSSDSLMPVYTAAVVSICFYGFFASPLDSARVSWLFFFFLVAGLAGLRVRKRVVSSVDTVKDSS